MKTYFSVLFCVSMAWLPAQQAVAPARMAGALDVSATGAAVYTVPLAVPPGIGESVPALALTYNSQGGDGIAGWGWNLAGLSTISRVGATLHHDGIIDPVDFDALDRFNLDGQRLLLHSKHAYGANNSRYQTENYTNILIVAKGQLRLHGGTTPAHFEVYYPDGSRAWYGLGGNSFGQLEWVMF